MAKKRRRVTRRRRTARGRCHRKAQKTCKGSTGYKSCVRLMKESC